MKRRAFSATLWGASEILVRHGIQFATMLVLARLVSPSEFGVVAMLAIFIGIAGVIADGGLSVALIQRRDVDHADESTVFWFNLGVGAVLAATLCLTAPLIADFYRVPVLERLAQAMSIVVVAGAAGSIHFALLSKQLEFRTQVVAGGLAALCSGGVAIYLALTGYGIWALAAQAILAATLTTAFLWALNPWRPAWTFRVASLRKFAAFGGYQLGAALMEAVYARFYTLLVGRMFGAQPLGYYANADATRQLPTTFVGGVAARVALPILAQAGGDPGSVRRGMQLGMRMMTLLLAPVMLAMFGFAELIIEVMFGSTWLPAAPLLRVLALSGLLYPIHVMNLHALLAQGQARTMFRIEIAKKAIGVLALLVGAQFGVLGIAWSQAAHSVLILGLSTHYARRSLGYGTREQLRDIAPPLVFAAVALAIVVPLDGWPLPAVLKLPLLLSIAGAVYLAILVVARTHVWTEVKGLLRESAK